MQLESIAQARSLLAALSWRNALRCAQQAGLHNDLKPGRLGSTGEDEIAALINTTLTPKPPSWALWSQSVLAGEIGLSMSAVHCHIVGHYLNSPGYALVRCDDEKSLCQALECTQPVLSIDLGCV